MYNLTPSDRARLIGRLIGPEGEMYNLTPSDRAFWTLVSAHTASGGGSCWYLAWRNPCHR